MLKLKLIAAALFLTCPAYPQHRKMILFVCEHGAARSAIAAAYFNKMAKERGLNYEAQFKGTDPQDSLTTGTRLGLAQDGFDVSKFKPALVTGLDVSNADRVITFDCQLPSGAHPKDVAQWDGIPPISKDYEAARDQIVSKINELLKQLPTR